MNEHGVRVEDRSVTMDHGLVSARAEPSGPNRRVLLGGLAAGVAGLLLPRSAVARDITRGIRFEIFNKEWDDIPLQFWILDGNKFVLRDSRTLKTGASPAFKTSSECAELRLGGGGLGWQYDIRGRNPALFTPFVRITYNPGDLSKQWDLKEGDSVWWANPRNNDLILISRRRDSADYKEFYVILRKGNKPTSVPLG